MDPKDPLGGSVSRSPGRGQESPPEVLSHAGVAQRRGVPRLLKWDLGGCQKSGPLMGP